MPGPHPYELPLLLRFDQADWEFNLSQIDQGELYTGENVAHGINHIERIYFNGMMTLCGP